MDERKSDWDKFAAFAARTAARGAEALQTGVRKLKKYASEGNLSDTPREQVVSGLTFKRVVGNTESDNTAFDFEAVEGSYQRKRDSSLERLPATRKFSLPASAAQDFEQALAPPSQRKHQSAPSSPLKNTSPSTRSPASFPSDAFQVNSSGASGKLRSTSAEPHSATSDPSLPQFLPTVLTTGSSLPNSGHGSRPPSAGLPFVRSTLSQPLHSFSVPQKSSPKRGLSDLTIRDFLWTILSSDKSNLFALRPEMNTFKANFAKIYTGLRALAPISDDRSTIDQEYLNIAHDIRQIREKTQQEFLLDGLSNPERTGALLYAVFATQILVTESPPCLFRDSCRAIVEFFYQYLSTFDIVFTSKFSLHRYVEHLARTHNGDIHKLCRGYLHDASPFQTLSLNFLHDVSRLTELDGNGTIPSLLRIRDAFNVLRRCFPADLQIFETNKVHTTVLIAALLKTSAEETEFRDHFTTFLRGSNLTGNYYSLFRPLYALAALEAETFMPQCPSSSLDQLYKLYETFGPDFAPLIPGVSRKHMFFHTLRLFSQYFERNMPKPRTSAAAAAPTPHDIFQRALDSKHLEQNPKSGVRRHSTGELDSAFS